MNKKQDLTVQAVFEDYGGKKRWYVKHPKYQQIIVAAPDDVSTMVAAAECWGERWQSYSFYPYCDVTICK